MPIKKNTVAVIGTGMMATGLIVLTAGHGFPTLVLVRSPESEARCKAGVDAYFRQMLDKHLLTEHQLEVCNRLVTYTQDYAALSEAEAVFECVVEKLAVKQEVYHAIEECCPQVKAICSVSSSIVPNALSGAAEKYADRILVTHPFNPPHLVPYFEVCAADRTAPEVLDYVKALLVTLDRKPVVLKKPTPGFIGNRLQFALWREALALVEEGVCEPEDVDACLNYSFCPRYTSIGIFQHFDNGGLELNAATCRATFPILSDRKDIPDFMRELMDAGKLGARSPTKQGFYDWNGVDMEAYAEKVSEPYWKYCKWKFSD